MNEKKKQEIPMPFKFDDFFTTQKQRDDAVKEKIEEIDISLIDNFKDHPFKVLDNDDMKSLKESIKTSGILSPVIIREKEDGRYEMLSGHRRMFACKSLGIDKIKCIIKRHFEFIKYRFGYIYSWGVGHDYCVRNCFIYYFLLFE